MTQNLSSLPDDLSFEVLESLNRLSQWRERANCKGKRKLFFGHHSERPQARIRRETKAGSLCKCCEVKPDCREFARLTVNTVFGAAKTRSKGTWPASR
ncbi:MAG: WhiB family transcriptional regulator [Actinomycetota bacterium]